MEKERHIFDFEIMMGSAYIKLNYIRSVQPRKVNTNKQKRKPRWRVNVQRKTSHSHVSPVNTLNYFRISGKFFCLFHFHLALVAGLAGIFKSMYHFSLFCQPKSPYFSKLGHRDNVPSSIYYNYKLHQAEKPKKKREQMKKWMKDRNSDCELSSAVIDIGFV